jgi:hypothetical protein
MEVERGRQRMEVESVLKCGRKRVEDIEGG